MPFGPHNAKSECCCLRKSYSDRAGWIKRVAGRMPFYRHLGINLIQVGRGSAEIQLKVERRLTQSAGFAHGGVAAALIDSAVGLALCTMLDPEQHITTVELHVNYMAPAKLGVLKSRGKIIHKGKRIAVGDAEVRDERGKLVSKGSATYIILENSQQRTIGLS
jgi:uncharacterized protein (TIGR00369 family)